MKKAGAGTRRCATVGRRLLGLEWELRIESHAVADLAVDGTPMQRPARPLRAKRPTTGDGDSHEGAAGQSTSSSDSVPAG